MTDFSLILLLKFKNYLSLRTLLKLNRLIASIWKKGIHFFNI